MLVVDLRSMHYRLSFWNAKDTWFTSVSRPLLYITNDVKSAKRRVITLSIALYKFIFKFMYLPQNTHTSVHQHINAFTVKWSEGFRNLNGLYVPIQIQLFYRNTAQVITAAIKLLTYKNLIEIYIGAFWCAYMHNYSIQLIFMNHVEKSNCLFEYIEIMWILIS